MRARSIITALVGLCASVPPLAKVQLPAAPLSFERLAAECAPDIHPVTLKALVRTESSWNPYAIGVVGGKLERQPRSLAEAVATARALERQGFNFSMGLGQVNRHNLPKHGETYDTVFEPCRNLKAGGAILRECFQRAKRVMGDEQSALRAAFSCYYSGNFTRGFRADKAGQPSYVQKVVANASSQVQPIQVVPAIQPQKSGAAVAVPAPGGPATSAKQAEAPSRWVIFAEGQPQNDQLAVEPAKESAAKVRLSTQGRDASPSVQAEQASVGRKAHALPAQRVAPGNQLDAPFVQFID